MNMVKSVVLALGIGVLVGGCGKGRQWDETTYYDASFGTATVSLNYVDALYYDDYKESYGIDESTLGKGEDTACSKRAKAIEMSRRVFSYTFKNYVLFDGVSGLIYNIGYICSIPHKFLRGLKSFDGVFCYLHGVFKLAWGTVAAAVGIVVAPVVNTIFHPFETLANLTVGLVFVDVDNTQHAMGLNWLRYVFYTNIVYSTYDIVWGGIIAPLLQTFIFWW